MLHKSFSVLETKADGEHGEFTAIVSTFGNVDRVGDRIMPGAWTKTLKQWTDSGDPIPIILAHQWDDPMAHIGIANASDVKQVKQGLQVTGKLDVEDNPVAKQVYKLMKRRSLKEFSIGYDVPIGGEKRAADGANEISEINLAECGPCLKGIDPKTELTAVKSALAEKELPDADKQRAEAKRVEREVEEQQIPNLPSAPSKAMMTPAQMAVRMRAMAEEMASDSPPDPKAMAARMRAMADEMANMGKAEKPGTELQEVKARLEDLEKALEDQKTKTVEVMEPRSVDPLQQQRQQAEQVALEIASGGLDRLPQRQVKAPEPTPDLMDLDELKQRSRDLMLQVLTGTE